MSGIFRSVAVLLALSLIGVGVIAGITIKIRNKAGQVVGQATVPDGSDITADEQGRVRVRMPNGKVLELTDNDTTKRSEQVLPDAAPASADVSPSVPATPLPFDAQSADKYREEFAESQGLPTFKDNSIEMNLALVPPGEFDMGSSEQELPYFMKFTEKEIADRINPDPNWVAWVRGRVLAETPRHRVQITQPFYMGTCEVTVGQFKRFAEESGFRRQAEEDGSEGWGRHHPEDDWPMMMVTWDEARAFCKWLSDEEDATYRLPTEAEWEYAARAGGTSSWFFDGNESGLEKVAWYKLNAAAPNPVGQKQPNSFGLYDVYGNVWEWCEDGYVEQYYRTAPPRDPKGPSGNIGQRVTRGGGFLFDFHECRSANKRPQFPEMARSYLGFRVVCEVHDQSQ